MKARIHPPTPSNLRRLAGVLRRGGLVALPTETVYGLAAHALDAKACRAIFRAKGRPAHDPLIVHVPGLAQAEPLAEFNDAARKLARAFWPGALTIVLPKKPVVPGIVTAGGPTVALRAPAHPLARKLLQLAGVPLAAPSANPFSYISPTTAEHVRQGLGSRIAHILDGGDCAIGVESTVVDLTHPTRPRILRPGAISAAQVGRMLKCKVTTVRHAPRRGTALLAPGLLDKHYSPRTPLQVIPNARSIWISSWVKNGRAGSPNPASGVLLTSNKGGVRRPRPTVPKRLDAEVTAAPNKPRDGTGLILLRRPAGKADAGVYWLSRSGALAEIARNLYRVLRLADAAGHRRILIERVPPTAGGLAAALNDRIDRAAAK